jgi:hypothetical protein
MYLVIRLDASNLEYITNHYMQNVSKFQNLTFSQNLTRHYLSLI